MPEWHDAVELKVRGGVHWLMIAGLILAGALLAGGCGAEGSGGSTPSGVAVEIIDPVEPQRLAFASDNLIGVVEGREIREVASLPGNESAFDEITWSGDGRQLGWVSYIFGEHGYRSGLTMVDLESGARQVWDGVNPPIRPGTTGILGSDFEGRFRQYLPGGEVEDFTIRIPPPPDPERTEPAPTYVLGALPSEGAWLVAAENSERLAMPAYSYRLFRFDPQRPELVPRASIRPWVEPTRLDDHRVVWIDDNYVDSCRNSDRVTGYRVRAPALPARSDQRSWRLRRVISANGEIDVLARGTGGAYEDRPGYEDDCAKGEGSFRWLALRDGSWQERGSGLVELDLAEDGRVARVEGEVCEVYEYDSGCVIEGEGEYEALRFGHGHLDFPDGFRLDLPVGTQILRFSPATPIAVRRTVGEGPELSVEQPLNPDGFGALRFGAAPEEIQAATRSALSFDLDPEGCGSARLADAGAARELGVEGRFAGGRLVALVVSTRDVPADEEHPALSEFQPDVSEIVPRGPRTDRGVGAGDSVDRLLDEYGTPSGTRVDPLTESTAYRFEVDGVELTALVDGSATIRRLELRRGKGGGTCAG